MGKEIRSALFAALLVVLGMFAGYKLHQGGAGIRRGEVAKDVHKLSEALQYVEENYVDEPDHGHLVDDAIQGMLGGLDPHSFYIPPVENKAMEEQMEGSFEGIGVEFNLLDDTIYVVAPISGGPSESAGILSGDRIVTIEGENVAGKHITNSDVMKKLKGRKGTKVKIQVKRRGFAKLLDFEITRDKIPLLSVDFSYMIDEKTGYIRVSRFARNTHEEFVQHLEKLKAKGMQRLMLDLRDNPGGYMDQAQELADEFLSSGQLVVYTEGRSAQANSRYEATSAINGFEKGPLVVLMNYGSASASEIVAGAIQDWDRGLIVGVRSFGKGLVQTQHDFSDGSAMRIVVSKYYTPSGRCIQKPYHMSSEEYEEEILDRFESGEIYDSTKMKLPDSLKFKTHGGRTVYGGGGIVPDVFVPRDTSYDSDLLGEYSSQNLFRQFTFDHPSLGSIQQQYPTAQAFIRGFHVDDAMLAAFRAFADSRVKDKHPGDFERSAPLIRTLIKANFGKRLYKDEGFFPAIHETDRVFREAMRLWDRAGKL